MGSIASTVLYSDIHRITRSVFPSSEKFLYSIDRHYVRPIVRGKETKSVEFGAKVNNIQIDGISFIEHLSFKAFNEGIRLKEASALKSHITRSQE